MLWKVADVMTTEVVRVDAETEFKACVDLLRLHSISALPVVDDEGRVTGIVSEADLLLKEEERGKAKAHLRHGEHRRAAGRVAADVMSAPAVCVGPDASIAEAARLMHKRGLKRLPVIDTKGRLVGIVSRADLLKPFLRSDESIRREVAEQILRQMLAIDPADVTVDVRDGIVALDGHVETKSLAGLADRLVEGVEGVVGVKNKLTYRLDDSHLRPELPPMALQLPADERKL